MAFRETPRFPENISAGSSGGPRWRTEIVVSQSGHEQRNQGWGDARHEYNVAYGIKDIIHLEQLKDFFMSVRGMVDGFRYKDWADFNSTRAESTITELDQVIGTGDGVETNFQLIKNYGTPEYKRPIKKPVLGTVIVAVDGILTPATVDYSIGIVTITPAPANNLVVTAGYEFDVPCRFATDILSTQMEVYYLGETTVPLLEIRI